MRVQYRYFTLIQNYTEKLYQNNLIYIINNYIRYFLGTIKTSDIIRHHLPLPFTTAAKREKNCFFFRSYRVQRLFQGAKVVSNALIGHWFLKNYI